MRIDSNELTRLSELRALSSAHGVLSVYLPLDPAVAQRHGYLASLLNVLRELRAASPAAAARIQEESDRVLAFAREEFVPRGSGLVVFSSVPDGIWQAFSFQLPVPALARFGDRPYLLPLAALSEDYAPAMVALINHEEARFYSLQLGELSERHRISTDVPGYQRQGGWAAASYEKDREHHIDEHMHRVSAELASLNKDGPFEALVLAGTDETTHALAAVLPEELRSKLAGSFAGEMFASDADIVDSARTVLATKERQREADLAQRLVDTALGGGQAALARDETLQMLREGRARNLVVSASVAYQGDAEEAYLLAEAAGLPVEVVHGAAEETLAPYGGLAAELRY